MADLEGNYHSINAKSNTSKLWFQAACVFVGGSCLFLFVMSASAPSLTIQGERSATLFSSASTLRQLGRGQGLRSPYHAQTSQSRGSIVTCALRKNRKAEALFEKYGIGKDPIATFAISSLGVSQRSVICKHGEAELLPEEAEAQRAALLATMGQSTPTETEKIEEVTEEVVLKARDMAGITAPMDLFDPLGFSTDTSAGRLLFFREVELKHGRVGMLASLGILVAEHFHPMFGGKIDVPSYIAFQQTPLQKFWPAVLVAIAIPEIMTIDSFISPNQHVNSLFAIKDDSGVVPGALGFDPLNLWPKDKKEQLELQNKELNNGRLAMIAAAGMIAQEVATGKKLF